MKKGLLIGAAVGGLLYVMWRRSRAGESLPEPQTPAWQPPAPAAPVAAEPAADEQVDEEEIGQEPADEPAAEPSASVAQEPPVAPAPVAPARHEEPTLRHPGRSLPLTSSGFASKPRRAAFRSSDRPQAAQARISWPGTGGPAAQRPKPLRLVPARARPSSLRRSR